MRQVVRSMRLRQPPDRVFAACVESLRTADRGRGVVARRCEPDPPVEGTLLVSTVREPRGGERELLARVVRLDPPREVATANEGPGAAVRTTLRLDPDGHGGTLLTLTSEADSGFPVGGRAGRVLDALLMGGPQRRSARATLRRIRELVGG